MESRSVTSLVRAYFAAYEARDRSALEELLAEDFVFTSPLDQRLDRAAYFQRRWPFSEEVRAFDLERVFAQGDEAFVQYLCTPRAGETFDNTELFRVAEGRIAEVVVYFGSAAVRGGYDPEAEIRALVAGWADALRAKDVAARTASLAEDVEAFDVVGPLRRAGAEALRRRAAEWFATFQGPIESEVRDLKVAATRDVAFCHGLTRFRGTRRDGGALDMWIRSTTGFRRVGGEWRVVHDHGSVPIDPETGRPALDLAP